MHKTKTIKPPKNFLYRNIILGTKEEDIYKNEELNIDECIANEIQELWNYGIHTKGCCCGHGKDTGFIQVERTDIKHMLDLGYEWYIYPNDNSRFDAFIPKTKCKCKKEEKKKPESEETKDRQQFEKTSTVVFINRRGTAKILGQANNYKETITIIKQFLDKCHYTAPYWRVNFYPDFIEFDVGSWSEFFRVYDKGVFKG